MTHAKSAARLFRTPTLSEQHLIRDGQEVPICRTSLALRFCETTSRTGRRPLPAREDHLADGMIH
jgi:hypothetical protein